MQDFAVFEAVEIGEQQPIVRRVRRLRLKPAKRQQAVLAIERQAVDVIETRQQDRVVGGLQDIIEGLASRIGDKLIGIEELCVVMRIERVGDEADGVRCQRVAGLEPSDPGSARDREAGIHRLGAGARERTRQ